MEHAPVPNNEKDRIKAVKGLGILDTPTEERFDAITKEASEKLSCPISTITIIDSDREWFKSCECKDGTITDRESDRSTSFCGHAMLAEKIFVIPDASKDPRFKDNPHVTADPPILFYAGVALTDRSGNRIGVLCVKDHEPREFSLEDMNILMELAERAEGELNSERVSEPE